MGRADWRPYVANPLNTLNLCPLCYFLFPYLAYTLKQSSGLQEH